MAETAVVESPAASTTVAETPTVATPVTEAPSAETPVTETPAIANPVAETPKVETSVAKNSIEQFASGTSIVSSPNNQKIKSIKDYLAKNANTKIILIGYASSEGDINFNKSLSEKRSQSMKDYLTSNGIDGTRISSQGGGIENPIGDNNTEAGRKQNRRVEVLFK
jgi:OOP family OmpA-OmpF porin